MAAQTTTLEQRLEFARPTPGTPRARTTRPGGTQGLHPVPRPTPSAPPRPHREKDLGTTGRTFPTRQGAKRKDKDNANMWTKALSGKGPARTRKG